MVTDLRARLADALREHAMLDDEDWQKCQCGHPTPWATHLADVLLSLLDIAIVELPEPDSLSPHAWHDGSVTAAKGCGRVRCHLGDHRLPAGEARSLAAALLAAANAAEATSHER